MTQKINFVEVGPRDGFQNVKEFIPTEEKLKVIDMLIDAGVKSMEIGSFVHPKAIPQMKDIKEVVTKTLEKHGDEGIDFFALVPNLYGAKAATACGLKKIDTVISVSESHNKANINRTVEESLQGLANIREELPDMDIILSMATAFTCPFEGITPVENVLRIIRRGVQSSQRRPSTHCPSRSLFATTTCSCFALNNISLSIFILQVILYA